MRARNCLDGTLGPRCVSSSSVSGVVKRDTQPQHGGRPNDLCPCSGGKDITQKMAKVFNIWNVIPSFSD